MGELLEVGRIAKAHGLKGEVIVSLSTDRDERLAPGTVLETEQGPMTVESAAPHAHRWRVVFAGLSTREDAEAVAGRILLAEPLDDPDAWFVHELIGLPVQLADGTAVGTCVAVVENPAYDMVELQSGALVPMPFVTEVTDDHVVIEPPEGLLEL